MYAFFNSRLATVISRKNSAQVQLMGVDNAQYSLVTQKSGLQLELSSQRQKNAEKKSEMYKVLAGLEGDAKDQYKDQITAFDNQCQAQEEEINQQTTVIAMKESAFDVEKKGLETQITKLEKEEETTQKALTTGVEHANPNYAGMQA